MPPASCAADRAASSLSSATPPCSGSAARSGPRAAMATPDQKSPNVLLQSLCCRILGKSEGNGVPRHFPGGSARSPRGSPR